MTSEPTNRMSTTESEGTTPNPTTDQPESTTVIYTTPVTGEASSHMTPEPTNGMSTNESEDTTLNSITVPTESGGTTINPITDRPGSTDSVTVR